MPEPNVLIREVDISNRVPIPPGISAAAVLTSKRGPWNPKGDSGRGVGIPTLINNDQQFMDFFGIPEIDSDPMYFDILTYLSYANSIWVIRAGNGEVSTEFGQSIPQGTTDPADYLISDGDGGNPSLQPNQLGDSFLITVNSPATTYDVNRISDGALVVNNQAFGVLVTNETFLALFVDDDPGPAVIGDSFVLTFNNVATPLAYSGALLQNAPVAQQVVDPSNNNTGPGFLTLGSVLVGSNAVGDTLPRLPIGAPSELYMFTVTSIGPNTYTLTRMSDGATLRTGILENINFVSGGLLSHRINAGQVLGVGDNFLLFMEGTALWNPLVSGVGNNAKALAIAPNSLVANLYSEGGVIPDERPLLRYGYGSKNYIIEVTSVSPIKLVIKDKETDEILASDLSPNTDYFDTDPEIATTEFYSLRIDLGTPLPVSPTIQLGFKWEISFQKQTTYGFRTSLTAPTTRLTGSRVQPFDFSDTILPNSTEAFTGIAFYAKNPGVWGNTLSIRIKTDPSQGARLPTGASINAQTSKGAYILEILEGGVLVESFAFATYNTAVDGFGRSAYLPDVLNQSIYLSAEVSDFVSTSLNFQLPVSSSTTYVLGGGQDGSYPTITSRLSKMAIALQQIEDAEVFEVATIIIGDWTAPVDLTLSPPYNTTYLQEATRIAEAREDSIVIGSTQLASERASNIFSTVAGQVSLSNEISALLAGVGNRSSYAAIYSPHVQDAESNIGAIINKSPAGYVAGIISVADINFARWNAPAGWRRGVLDVIGVSKVFTKAERNVLYETNVNPIRVQRNRGIVVWGDKTLQVRPSALSVVGTRLLLTVLKPIVRTALEDFIFEINDENTRSEVRSILESAVSQFVAKRGISEYLVVVDERNNPKRVQDQQKLVAWIFIKPILSINFIDAAVIITRSDVNLQVLASQGGF